MADTPGDTPATAAASKKKAFTVQKNLTLNRPWAYSIRPNEDDGIDVDEPVTVELIPLKGGKVNIHIKGMIGTLKRFDGTLTDAPLNENLVKRGKDNGTLS